MASQEWFTRNLENALKVVPKEKIVCAIGNYGYDWSIVKQGRKTVASATSVSAQQAWLTASESEAEVEYDPDRLNPHYAYLDGEVRHDVWFLDGATALNQMRAAIKLGINTFALWRLGSEDRSLWPVWDLPGKVGVAQELRLVPPGQEVDMEGEGEILRIAQRPLPGERSFTLDPAAGLITEARYVSLPRPYPITQYGACPNRIAIPFDDGPDPS